jgi:hypothetical protein
MVELPAPDVLPSPVEVKTQEVIEEAPITIQILQSPNTH